MKVGIIGSGLVGSTSAYAMVMTKAASEIVMVDANEKRAIAEAADIQHAIPFTHATDVYAGDYNDLKGANVIVIAAGASQKPGETRLQLFEKNAAILNHIIPRALVASPETIFLIATNPVDIITHISAKIAGEYGVPYSRVIGSGTTLDTARFRALLGSHACVDPQHVHGYVIGEHGDSEVLTWSNIDIGGIPFEDFINHRNIGFGEEIKQQIDSGVRNAAYKIIEGKGSTYYGIGAAIARIVDAINRDNRAVLTVCTVNEEVEGVKDVTLSLPHLISGKGDLGTLPLRLSDEERMLLQKSAMIIREKIDEYENK
ncbi:MAG: L-lactate dehydrogenase [Bacteroidota bacterium]